MGTDFKVACEDCFEFLELHKWFPDNELSGRYPCDLKYGKYCGSETSKRKIERAIEATQNGLLKECSERWIEKLIPYIECFLLVHGSHNLVIYNDCGDMPWYPYEEGWHRWKEIDGPMACWGKEFNDVDLPRNIIDDIGIKTWEDAKKHYEEKCPCITYPKMPNELKDIFLYYLPKT